MEAIRNYLETMFLHLPNTPEVLRAKQELGQMMEDKYTELIGEGKSENEAVGTVISEFGNLNELADELGLSAYLLSQNPAAGIHREDATGQAQGQAYTQNTAHVGEETQANRSRTGSYANTDQRPRRILSMQEVKEYLHTHSRSAVVLALGIMLCILSPSISAMVDNGMQVWRELLGNICLFLFVGCGVGLILIAAEWKKSWKLLLKNENCSIDFASTKYVEDQREQYKSTHAILLVLGIILCIFSVLPTIIMEGIADMSKSAYVFFDRYDLGSFLLFLFVGVGVFLIVSTNAKMNAFDRLLHLNGADTVGGNYVPNQQKKSGLSGWAIALIAIAASIALIVCVIVPLILLGFFRYGVSVSSKDPIGTMEYEVESDLTSLDLDLDLLEVTITQSADAKTWKAVCECPSRLMPSFEEEDGTLYIKERGKKTWRGKTNRLTITGPADQSLAAIAIDVDLGAVHLNNVTAESLDIDSDMLHRQRRDQDRL